MILCILLCFSSDLLSVIDGKRRDAEPIDEGNIAKGIAERASSGVDICHTELASWLNELCDNLDEVRRVNLTIKVMICEFTKDGRLDNLPEYDGNSTHFMASLDDNLFDMFTTYFTSIDSLCFHASNERQSHSNLEKVGNIFAAVNFSTEFLKDLKKEMVKDHEKTKQKLDQINDQISHESDLMLELMSELSKVYDTLANLSSKSQRFRDNLDNAKVYLISLAVAFAASFLLPNIFLPILCITGIWLFMETSSNIVSRIGPRYLMISYLVICSIILVSSLWSQIVLIKERIFRRNDTRGKIKVPKIY